VRIPVGVDAPSIRPVQDQHKTAVVLRSAARAPSRSAARRRARGCRRGRRRRAAATRRDTGVHGSVRERCSARLGDRRLPVDVDDVLEQLERDRRIGRFDAVVAADRETSHVDSARSRRSGRATASSSAGVGRRRCQRSPARTTASTSCSIARSTIFSATSAPGRRGGPAACGRSRGRADVPVAGREQLHDVVSCESARCCATAIRRSSSSSSIVAPATTRTSRLSVALRVPRHLDRRALLELRFVLLGGCITTRSECKLPRETSASVLASTAGVRS
jgi:hypothetical protein